MLCCLQVDHEAVAKLYNFLYQGFWRGLQADALLPTLQDTPQDWLEKAVEVLRDFTAMRAAWLGNNTKRQAAAAAQLLELSSGAFNGGICGFLSVFEECRLQGVITAAAQALGFTPTAAKDLEEELLQAWACWQPPAELAEYDAAELGWDVVALSSEQQLPMPDAWAAGECCALLMRPE